MPGSWRNLRNDERRLRREPELELYEVFFQRCSKVGYRPIADVAERPSLSQALIMIFYGLALLIGVVGGIVVGACVFGRWRRPVLWLWLALPLIVYSSIMFWGGVEGGSTAWSEASGWWLIGLLGYVGLPMLVFAASSVLGFFVAPALKAKCRLKDWRLPQ